MQKALIGYTGFVGRNLICQTPFDHLYNSKNISRINGMTFDLLICAAPSAAKWKARENPDQDLQTIKMLMTYLKEVQTNLAIHISTVDVYESPINVHEDSKVNPEESEPYGRHRFQLEEFFRSHFKNFLIVRLPALFGNGLKKNFVFDLIHNHCLHLTHKDSRFQFYYLNNLWKDIQIALSNNLRLINIASEPISAEKIARECFNVEFKNITSEPPVWYDMKTNYSNLYGGGNGYIYNKEIIFQEMKEYVNNCGIYSNHENCHL